MKKKLGVCYLCGNKAEITDDHVPPKNLAPKTPDSEFILLPACEKCNGKYSHEESKFRDFVVSAGAHRGLKSADDALEAAIRNFTRNPPKDGITPQKDLQRLIKNHSIVDVIGPDGVSLGKSHAITVSDDLNWRSVLVKIARGLHYKYTNQIIPDTNKIEVNFIKEIELPDIYKSTPYAGSVGDFFHYRGGPAVDEPTSGVWYLAFYKQVGAIVLFIKPKPN